MTVATVRKYVMFRGKIESLEFALKHGWVRSDHELLKEDCSCYPESCVSVYYTLDLENKQITNKYFVTSWHPKYKDLFKEISVAWLEEYFSVEENDLKQLDKPEENIIAPGGEIFSLLDTQGNGVGVVAMIDHDGKQTELGKLGVRKNYAGKGLSNPLMYESILWAKQHEKRYPWIILYTAAHLGPAVNLYKKYGFEPVPKGDYDKFARVDLVMRLTL